MQATLHRVTVEERRPTARDSAHVANAVIVTMVVSARCGIELRRNCSCSPLPPSLMTGSVSDFTRRQAKILMLQSMQARFNATPMLLTTRRAMMRLGNHAFKSQVRSATYMITTLYGKVGIFVWHNARSHLASLPSAMPHSYKNAAPRSTQLARRVSTSNTTQQHPAGEDVDPSTYNRFERHSRLNPGRNDGPVIRPLHHLHSHRANSRTRRADCTRLRHSLPLPRAIQGDEHSQGESNRPKTCRDDSRAVGLEDKDR